MKLEVKTKNDELLFHLISDLGSTFWRYYGNNNEVEVVYVSGNRFVYFTGKISDERMNLLRATGFMVNSIKVDEEKETLEIQ